MDHQFFLGYLEDERSPSSVRYQGKHDGNWMMPSFIKEFSAPGLLSVWTRAFEAVQLAEEVVVIGYSLPEADSAACLLLGTNGIAGKRLTLVNPQADSLQARYRLVTGNDKIVSYAAVTEYLQ